MARGKAATRRKVSKPDERAAMVLAAISTGANIEDCFTCAGVSPREAEQWLTDQSFSRDIEVEKAKLAVLAAATLRRAAQGDVAVAQRVVDRQAAHTELRRLHDVSGVDR
jgi:hypothetical protein